MSGSSGDSQVAKGHHQAQAMGPGSTAIVASYEYAPPRPVDAETLAQAERRLAELPLDVVPGLASLPHGSVMPLSPNPLFVGRGEELKALAAKLKADATTDVGPVVIAATTGLGGIGKTQLASEFVHRYGYYFSGGVFWLTFADADAIPTEVAACGGAGRMELRPDFHTLPLADQIREVMSAWQSAMPRLLVFDNCEDQRLLAEWRPPTGGCRVLVTSRKERWDRTIGVEALRLDVLSREESVALLREHYSDLPERDPQLDAISQELGDLPLALDLAGRYLAKYRLVITPSQYLEELQRPDLLEHRSLQEGGLSPTEHEQNVARTFALSYERLNAGDPTDAVAVALLARAAYFAPGESIPHELLLKTLEMPEGDLEAPLLAEDALGMLSDLGMLQEQEQGAQRMHRLVAAFVRGVVDGEEAQRAVEETILEAITPLTIEGNPQSFSALLPHLRAITNVAEEREDYRAAHLCDQLGKCLYIMGAYGEARTFFQRALSITKEVFGEDHPDTVMIINNLALVLGVQGDYDGARQLFEQALSINERVWGEDHPSTALSLNNLAIMLFQQGDYDRVLSLHQRALAIREKVLGEEHPDTAQSLINLANVLVQARGDYEAARTLFERSLVIHERVYGEDHPDTALSLNGLALVLSDQGDYEAARTLFERSLAIREKVLGEEHPDTAQSLYNLALVLLRNQGDYKGIRRLLERSLMIYERALGAEHPRTRAVREQLDSLEG